MIPHLSLTVLTLLMTPVHFLVIVSKTMETCYNFLSKKSVFHLLNEPTPDVLNKMSDTEIEHFHPASV